MDSISLPVALRKAKLPGSAPEHPGKTQRNVSWVHIGKRGIRLFRGIFKKHLPTHLTQTLLYLLLLHVPRARD